MSEKAPARPAWYKNTYFWIAAALFILSVCAFVRGPDVIRDPGQKREDGLAMWYLIASVVMYVNGWLSHQQTVRTYRETVGEDAPAKPISKAVTSPPATNESQAEGTMTAEENK